MEFAPSGKHYPIDQFLLNQVRQLRHKDAKAYDRWQARAGRMLTSMLGTPSKRKRAIDAKVTRPRPNLVAGDHHLATGPVVGKSTAFAEWLRRSDRKAAALEMETAAVFGAVGTQVERTRCLAIRGISDFADDRKSAVEKAFKGKFRSLSLTNAVEVFVLLAQLGVFDKVKP